MLCFSLSERLPLTVQLFRTVLSQNEIVLLQQKMTMHYFQVAGIAGIAWKKRIFAGIATVKVRSNSLS